MILARTASFLLGVAAVCGALAAYCLALDRLAPGDSARPLSAQRRAARRVGSHLTQVWSGYLASLGFALPPFHGLLAALFCWATLSAAARAELGLPIGAALFTGAAALILIARTLRLRRQRQVAALLQLQAPEVARMVATALRAGHNLHQTLTFVAREAPVPARDVFVQCAAKLALGLPLAGVLAQAVRTAPGPEFRLLLATIQIQTETGGNLVTALERLSAALRHRNETRSSVAATLARVRQTARLVPILPFAAAALLHLVIPGFLSPLWTPPGIVLLAATVLVQAAAAVALGRCLHTDV